MKKPKYIYTLTFLKQLALEWQIAKQLSGLNVLSVSNNKNHRLKKSFSFVTNIKQLLGQQYTKNSAASKADHKLLHSLQT